MGPAIDSRDKVRFYGYRSRRGSGGLFAAIVVEFCQRACRAEHRVIVGRLAAAATERRQQFVPIRQPRMRRARAQAGTTSAPSYIDRWMAASTRERCGRRSRPGVGSQDQCQPN